MTQEEILLIERYLDNSLTGLELKEFIDRLESDADFRNRVSFHNLLIEAIRDEENKRLIHEVEKFIGYRKPAVPVALKLIFTFLFITIGGIFLWYYIDPASNSEKHNYFSLDFLKYRKDNPEVLPVTEDKTSKVKKNILKPVTLHSDTFIAKNEEKIVKPDSADKINKDETDIVVKKDQLLISYNLKPKDLGGQNSKEDNSTSIAKSTAEKLNPAGGLPEIENKKTTSYTVEFWVSPVNYRGYKLINDKLILFGIDEPQAVELFTKDSKLWMKYGKEYYSLEQSDNFESFISTSEIPSSQR